MEKSNSDNSTDSKFKCTIKTSLDVHVTQDRNKYKWLELTWSESMPGCKNFLDSKAPSIPSAILECLTLYDINIS